MTAPLERGGRRVPVRPHSPSRLVRPSPHREELSAAGYAVEYAGSWTPCSRNASRLRSSLRSCWGNTATRRRRRRSSAGSVRGTGGWVFRSSWSGTERRQPGPAVPRAGADLVVAADLPPGRSSTRRGRCSRTGALPGRCGGGPGAAGPDPGGRAHRPAQPRHFVRDLERTVEMAAESGVPLLHRKRYRRLAGGQRVVRAGGGRRGDPAFRERVDAGEAELRQRGAPGGRPVRLAPGGRRPGQALQAARRAHRMVGESAFDGARDPIQLTATFGVASIIPGRSGRRRPSWRTRTGPSTGGRRAERTWCGAILRRRGWSMRRNILVYPDPFLARKAAPVAAVDDRVRTLIRDMFETMYAAEGVGLAAPQVGVGSASSCWTFPRGRERSPMAVVNPRSSSGRERIGRGGCLSVPGVQGRCAARRPSSSAGSTPREAAPAPGGRDPLPGPAARDRPPGRRPLHRSISSTAAAASVPSRK